MTNDAKAAPPIIPDMTILKWIGAGSFGDVWLARSVTGAYRAVKVVHRAHFDSDESYEREFNAIQHYEPLSRSHEGLVSILHVGRNVEAGYYYYVMELADDIVTGRDINPDRYMPWTLKPGVVFTFEEVVGIGSVLADALALLHQKGLVHRDIKLSNIVFVDGSPMLADPGLVAGVSSKHSYIGTDGYVPPEGAGLPSADVFALGKVLYEISTGLDRKQFPRLPSPLTPALTSKQWPKLNNLLIAACAKDRAERYVSVASLRADLQKISGQIPSEQASARLVRSNLKWIWIGLIVIFAVIVFAVKRHNDDPVIQGIEKLNREGFKVHVTTPGEIRNSLSGLAGMVQALSNASSTVDRMDAEGRKAGQLANLRNEQRGKVEEHGTANRSSEAKELREETEESKEPVLAETKTAVPAVDIGNRVPTNDQELTAYLRDTQWKFGNWILTLRADGIALKSWGRFTPAWRVKNMQLVCEGAVFTFSREFTTITDPSNKVYKVSGELVVPPRTKQF
jgi:serine/threonine protein kinase